ncbi:MAG: gamma-glutamylcyclotransferase [Nitrospirota bacterium]
MPFQRLLLYGLFDYPERKLVVYGTLAPGKANHGKLSGIQGHWEDCTVYGRIEEIDGLPFFVWQSMGPSLKAHLFISDFLPGSWDELDRFEGSKYKKILIPVTTSHGICVANSYIANHHSEKNKWRH